MKVVQVLLWITGICEGILGIPVLGGLLVFISSWSFLVYMLFAHIITLAFCIWKRKPFYPSVIGIGASALGWIPFLGMTLHILAAVFLIRNAVIVNKKSRGEI
ncbi:hypothetical protein [Paenibacillus luteus]|uniref:hypothetical protein n=1 Tax=Paenibacillus luteus TaxID=2545753 RepID=UPI00114295F5|nr:hypothetical protein [Paenibacillus luteus]